MSGTTDYRLQADYRQYSRPSQTELPTPSGLTSFQLDIHYRNEGMKGWCPRFLQIKKIPRP